MICKTFILYHKLPYNNNANNQKGEHDVFVKEINYKDLGMRLKRYRIENHLTQEELAEKVDTVPSTISHIERGTTKCSLPNLVKICNALNISLDQALCDSLTVVESQALDNDIYNLIRDCTVYEKKFIIEVLKIIKIGIRQYLKPRV
jgi:transcriptional regulator with XRE-family HTH domain